MKLASSTLVLVAAVTAAACVVPPPPSRAVVESRPVGVAVVTGAPLRYVLPPCPLRYEILTHETFSTEGMDLQANHIESFIVLEAATNEQRLELKVTLTAWLRMGTSKHRPFAMADTGFPPIRLATNGERWVDDGPPSLLYRGLGTVGGLEQLFPHLPPVAEHGARRQWRIERSESNVFRSGIAMSNSTSLPTWNLPKTIPLDLDVEVASVEGAFGTPLIVLRSQGNEDTTVTPAEATRFRVHGETRAEHTLLPGARLLRASFERNVDLEWDESDYHLRSHLAARMQAHLVRACDGPTEASLAPKLTREERAIAAVGELGVAVLSGKRDKALPLFRQELRARQGDDRIWRTIQNYRLRNGEHAWPLPILLEEDAVVADEKQVEVRSVTNVPKVGQVNTVTPARFRFQMIEEKGRFVVASITADLTQGRGTVFELSSIRAAP